MSEKKAIYYEQVELVPGVICDGYILDDQTTVMSERGTANLLGMAHPALRSVVATGLQNNIKPFMDNSLSVVTTLVEVVANNSPHKGREINVICESNKSN